MWHARGKRATEDGVTCAVGRGHRLGDSVASDVGEGRNNLLRRGRCADALCEAVQDRFGFSVGNVEDNLHDLEFDQDDIFGKSVIMTRTRATAFQLTCTKYRCPFLTGTDFIICTELGSEL